MEKVYAVQEYKVRIDLGPVEVSVTVYHENQTELGDDEIIAEALGYIEEAELELPETSYFEIEILRKE